LVEIVEDILHTRGFIGVQYHPEYKEYGRQSHGRLFLGFCKTALKHQKGRKAIN